MKIKKIIILVPVFFLSFSLLAQEGNKICTHQLELDFVDGKSVTKEDTTIIDELGYDFEDDDQTFENIPYHAPGIQFIYFEWMPGYGRYQNFDITLTHYKHAGAANSDTLIFGKYCHPVPFPISSNYGKRRRRMHYGVDMGCPIGTPIVAAFNGIVRCSKTNAGGYGNLIVIRHHNGLETYYAHLSKRLVNPGQIINAGDTIGLIGNTGRSYGSHLHFETRYLGTPFNPNNIIDCAEYKLKCDTLYITGCKNVDNTTAANTASASVGQRSGGNSFAVTSTNSANAAYYTVKNGDTLSQIAARYRTTVSKIKQLNGLRSDFLRIGQRLKIR
jgi:murein DD-endopeptidase MepM/ murein hydrolase activator NlpD